MTTADKQHRGHARTTLVVGLLADEGMPEEVARDLADDLPAVLTDQFSDRVD